MSDIRQEVTRAIGSLRIKLAGIDKEMRSDSKNNGLIDLAEIKKYQENLNSDIYYWNQYVLACQSKTIDDVIDREALKFFDIDRPYQEYLAEERTGK